MRAWNVMSGAIAASHLDVLDRTSDEPVESLLLDTIHPLITPYEFWEACVIHLMTDGNHYSLINGGKGKRDMLNDDPGIDTLFPLDPQNVTPSWVIQKGSNIPIERVYRVTLLTGEEVAFTEDQIWHVPGLSFNGLCGISPIEAAREAIGTNLAAEIFAGRLFGNGSLMSGILTTDNRLTEDQATSLKQRWQKKIAGLDHVHEIAVLDSGTTFQSLSIKPEDAQFIQARNFGVNEIARLTGVPTHLLMADESLSTNSTGIEQENIGFMLYSLRALSGRLEGRINKHLVPKTQHVRFNLSDFERGDTKTRWAAYLLARKASILTIDEIRIDDGRKPLGTPESTDPLTPLTGNGAGEESGGTDQGGDTTDQGGGDGSDTNPR